MFLRAGTITQDPLGEYFFQKKQLLNSGGKDVMWYLRTPSLPLPFFCRVWHIHFWAWLHWLLIALHASMATEFRRIWSHVRGQFNPSHIPTVAMLWQTPLSWPPQLLKNVHQHRLMNSAQELACSEVITQKIAAPTILVSVVASDLFSEHEEHKDPRVLFQKFLDLFNAQLINPIMAYTQNVNPKEKLRNELQCLLEAQRFCFLTGLAGTGIYLESLF